MTPFSFTVVGPPVNATDGATLFTVTGRCAASPVVPSLSVEAAVTIGEAGPSSKIHLKLPEVLLLLSLPATFVPPVPQAPSVSACDSVVARVAN